MLRWRNNLTMPNCGLIIFHTQNTLNMLLSRHINSGNANLPANAEGEERNHLSFKRQVRPLSCCPAFGQLGMPGCSGRRCFVRFGLLKPGCLYPDAPMKSWLCGDGQSWAELFKPLSFPTNLQGCRDSLPPLSALKDLVLLTTAFQLVPC